MLVSEYYCILQNDRIGNEKYGTGIIHQTQNCDYAKGEKCVDERIRAHKPTTKHLEQSQMLHPFYTEQFILLR